MYLILGVTDIHLSIAARAWCPFLWPRFPVYSNLTTCCDTKNLSAFFTPRVLCTSCDSVKGDISLNSINHLF